MTGIHIICVQVGYHLKNLFISKINYSTLLTITELKKVNDIEDYTHEFICECMYDTE